MSYVDRSTELDNFKIRRILYTTVEIPKLTCSETPKTETNFP